MNATTPPLTHSRPNLTVSIAALLAGAALSAGVIALADTNEVANPPAKASAIAQPASAPAPQPSDSQPAGARGLAAGLSGR